MTIADRYEPTGEKLGGGMGDIFLCKDTHLDRIVALKLIKTGEEERRLIDEQKALIKVRSKHVVQMYDIVQVESALGAKTALVLEYISGHDLSPSSFSPGNEYLKTIWQISCGLAEIHNAEVIHRDIKVNNIRVDDDNVVKILDFGLSRPEGAEACTIGTIGTPGYMAPELWQDSRLSFDRAVDVYAFGITALVLIERSIPESLLARPPMPVSIEVLLAFLDGVPIDVVNIIHKCLSHTPTDRPSMKAVEDTIRQHLLRGRHRAHLVLGQKTHEINMQSPEATIKAGEIGSIGIVYNGVCFTISTISGNVTVNNRVVSIGDNLPACCVITFASGASRTFVTFDVSNPEVTP